MVLYKAIPIALLATGADAFLAPGSFHARAMVRTGFPMMVEAEPDAEVAAVAPAGTLEAEFESVKQASQVAMDMAPAMETLTKQSKPKRGLWKKVKAVAGLGKAVEEAASDVSQLPPHETCMPWPQAPTKGLLSPPSLTRRLFVPDTARG